MSCDSSAKVAILEKRIALLEERLSNLECGNNYRSPWQAPQWHMPVQHCTKCGMNLDGVMGYVCSDPHCPTGLGPIMCKVGV